MGHSSRRRFPAVLIAAFLLGLSLALPAPAVRAGLVRWVVPTTDGPVVHTECTSILNFCSLREALAAAADGDTIQFHPQTTGAIVLDPTQGALPVTHAVTIAGPGAGTLAVDGGCTGCVPGGTPRGGVTVFMVNTGVTATISGLTIQHGSGTDGGGIDNLGTLTVMSSIIANNASQSGGGIASTGTLTVTNSTLSGNSANTGAGGGINNAGTVQVTNSTVTANIAINSGGGGIFNNAGGTLTVTNSTLSGNSAGGGGGGVDNNGGTVTVTNSALSGNSAGSGGGIQNSGTLTLTNSTLSSNSALASGGGILNGGGTLNGGVLDPTGTLTVTNSTFTGNSASQFGGGIANIGTLTVTNSTLSGNSASGVLGSSAGAGGGINDAATQPATLTNTIVANNPTGGDLTTSPPGGYTGSHNLIDDAANAGGFTDGASGNLVGHPALLGPLGTYGGTTQTFPLLPGSSAIDAGSCAPGYHDQRGIATVGAACDIGGFESQGFLLTAAAGTNQSTAVATTFATPLVASVSSAHSEPVLGGQVIFTAPTSGPGAAVASSSRTIGAGGTASVTATANGTAGAYGVTASAAGASGASFSLANTPVLSGISPASGATAGGNHVTLTGRGFGTSAANVAVVIGGSPTPVASITDTTLVATVPARGAGTVDVVVTVNGESVMAAGGYRYGAENALPNPQPSGGTPGNPNPQPSGRPSAVSAGSPNPLPPPRP